jgi:hypothetical protein
MSRSLLTRRLAAFAAVTNDSRGARFLRRQSREADVTLSLSDVATMPRWVFEPAETAGQIATIAALLTYRAVLDQELSGPRLRALGEAVGETCFDLACEAPRPAPSLMLPSDAELPPPETLVDRGWSMLSQGLPVAMAHQFPGAKGNADMAALAELAAALVLDTPAGAP